MHPAVFEQGERRCAGMVAPFPIPLRSKIEVYKDKKRGAKEQKIRRAE
ncbi:hypothetical protein RS130_12840 [Paraglaciecola aquimarina]|uniref:Uncharacterized protein n=1 Tax=Paraglaciecola aquimarina TaxID=1235557 RepID=A0ABU3SXE2_9ALTE|nr:hypothetical protein [Paraglaciecola aquimarina]MDU0354685.1 hypothetical protein [Paraglaciecola aquimarina]